MMQKETVRFLLDPVTRFTPGTEGLVDLYLMPAYDDIASLLYVGGEWRLHRMAPHDSGAKPSSDDEGTPLSREFLVRVLDEMMVHAAESP